MHSRISTLMKKAKIGNLFRNHHVQAFKEKVSLDSPLLDIPETDYAFIKEKSQKSVASPVEITPQEIQGIWQAYGPMRAAKITASGQVAAAQITATGQIESAKIRVLGAILTSGILGLGLYKLQSQASDQRKKADEATDRAEKETIRANTATENLANKNNALIDREKAIKEREQLATDVYSTYMSLLAKFEVADSSARECFNGNKKYLDDYDRKLKDAEIKGIEKSKDILAPESSAPKRPRI